MKMVNDIICNKLSGAIKGINRRPQMDEFKIEYEGNLDYLTKFDKEKMCGVNIKQDYSLFNAQEILDIIYKNKIKEFDKSNYLLDMFLDSKTIDLEDIKADTGVMLLSLLPSGYANMKPVKLKEKIKEVIIMEKDFPKNVTMYINSVKVGAQQKITLEETDTLSIRFVNNSKTKRQRVKKFSIAY